MGGCYSTTANTTPVLAYAHTHSRAQMHEVAVIPLISANFPSANCAAFQRLHEIYRTCPRVRQHFAQDEQPLSLEAFYKQVVTEASHPNLPPGTALPVAVATRWRGDEGWDVAGYIGCRGFDSEGRLNETCHLQMFFKDGHKVPLTMPAIQLAARLYAEMWARFNTNGKSGNQAPLQESASSSSSRSSTANDAQPSPVLRATRSGRVPWPFNPEWAIRRSNMEVRRVLEAVLVFWGLRPARTGVPDVPAPDTPSVDGSSPFGMPPPPPYGSTSHPFMPFNPYVGAGGPPPSNGVYPQMQQHHNGQQKHPQLSPSSYPPLSDAAPFMAKFPLEQRSLTDELLILGCGNEEAVASLMSDLALWSGNSQKWLTSNKSPSPGLELLVPDCFVDGSQIMLAALSMNFRGTQQKTAAERREVLGDEVADLLEHIQPLRDPDDPDGEIAAAAARAKKRPGPTVMNPMMMGIGKNGASFVPRVGAPEWAPHPNQHAGHQAAFKPHHSGMMMGMPPSFPQHVGGMPMGMMQQQPQALLQFAGQAPQQGAVQYVNVQPQQHQQLRTLQPQQQVVVVQQQPQQQQQPQFIPVMPQMQQQTADGRIAIQLPPPPAGYTYAFMTTTPGGTPQPVLVPQQQQQQPAPPQSQQQQVQQLYQQRQQAAPQQVHQVFQQQESPTYPSFFASSTSKDSSLAVGAPLPIGHDEPFGVAVSPFRTPYH